MSDNVQYRPQAGQVIPPEGLDHRKLVPTPRIMGAALATPAPPRIRDVVDHLESQLSVLQDSLEIVTARLQPVMMGAGLDVPTGRGPDRIKVCPRPASEFGQRLASVADHVSNMIEEIAALGRDLTL